MNKSEERRLTITALAVVLAFGVNTTYLINTPASAQEGAAAMTPRPQPSPPCYMNKR
jgi:hypothetical protein